MNYLELTADALKSAVAPELIPEGDTRLLFLLYALLVRAKGEDVQPEDVHDAWAVWTIMRGDDHESLVEFRKLDTATRAEDDPYVAAIRQVAREASR